jgi:hypothetical protein
MHRSTVKYARRYIIRGRRTAVHPTLPQRPIEIRDKPLESRGSVLCLAGGPGRGGQHPDLSHTYMNHKCFELEVSDNNLTHRDAPRESVLISGAH